MAYRGLGSTPEVLISFEGKFVKSTMATDLRRRDAIDRPRRKVTKNIVERISI
jgi:hypothetical protein